MKKILVLGAGLSSSYLIKYLLEHAIAENWQVTIADSNLEAAQHKTRHHTHATAIELNITNDKSRSEQIAAHDLVISMLPPSMHILAAQDCITYKKHLVTASYISDEMKQLDKAAKDAGVLLLNECGLDPGIDHLSAVKIIHEIEERGGTVTSFKSFCGGLVAPEYDDNPWNYKFTWNPRNVVLAGQATAKYLEDGILKFIPANHIFEQTESVSIDGYGDFESYANRDSLGYIEPYGITKAQTVLRGTLRKKGYSEAWNLLVKLGLTDDSFVIHHTDKLTLREWVNAFVPGTDINTLENRVCKHLSVEATSESFKKLLWLGILSDEKITLPEATPAQILQSVLQHKWKLNTGELDMIVMKHQTKFEIENSKFEIESELIVKGEDEVLTAMAKTVGLPMAIAAKLILQDKIQSRGVHMPILPEFYNPILAELENFGVRFVEKELRQ
ncbi:MAG: saccharopine dehydrogenase C-terminal domain-containing protein [Bacteroidota bacterium]